MSIPWTPGAILRCGTCGTSEPLGPLWGGCACGEPYSVEYAGAGPRLPIPASELTDLGTRPTPLVPFPGRDGTWLKLELLAPTGSHKDRFHAVTSAVARLGGARGVVTTSTGNHGVSCAAHAARDGLPCVVLSTAELPPALEAQIAAYGALVGKLAPGERRRALEELVAAGWHPATSADPALSGAANPYGLEGYRSVAREIADELGRLPEAVAVPVASGDAAVGILRELDRLAGERGAPPAAVVAVQPERAASLAASVAAGVPVTLAGPSSVARSTTDPATGRLAIAAFAGGRHPVVSVSEEEIVAATSGLAASGFYVEPSAALAVAGLERARAYGLAPRRGPGVAVVTSTGRGWLEGDPRFPAAPACSTAGELLARAGALEPAVRSS
jgi:threonine synthase